jgi:inositol-phosphate phosphatase/L-galactose 1-phosphate phosphatase/histidinol-phosphatase
MALLPVLRGAGAIVTDWDGEPVALGSDGRMAVAGDAAVHAEVLDLLADF